MSGTAPPAPLTVRFYLDFVSTYSYFAALEIDDVAAKHGATVDWQVVSLPHVFRAAGTVSPLEQPLKLAHNRQDVARLARMKELPFEPPVGPPQVRGVRIAFWHLKPMDPHGAARLAREAMALRFGEGREPDDPDALSLLAERAEVDADLLRAAAHDESAGMRLRNATERAVADGMFGAPFVVIDDQRFWGTDRVTMHLDWWLGRLQERSASPAPPCIR